MILMSQTGTALTLVCAPVLNNRYSIQDRCVNVSHGCDNAYHAYQATNLGEKYVNMLCCEMLYTRPDLVGAATAVVARTASTHNRIFQI